jgi:hypothetical protein
MNKIDQIKSAIFEASHRRSRLTPLALSVPALSSLQIRHLMNNLGSISTNYLEHGVHKGGLFCSTICNNPNLSFVCAVDNWASDATGVDEAEGQFWENAMMLKPRDTISLIIKKNSFDVAIGEMPVKYDLYLFDADHSEDSQCRALTHFLPSMGDEFIFCVDDYDWEDVRSGTERGIIESGVEILFRDVWAGNDHDNEGAWNGFAIFLLKKKP